MRMNLQKEKIMEVGYIRVSTAEQNEQRQVEAMKSFQIEKLFVEKVSAKDMHRPKLQEMLEFVREGDTVHIHDFSRLARSTADLLNIVDTLNRKGVTLISNKENIDTSTPTGKLMLTFIGAIAEFERQNLLDRQREGIALAKAAGKYKGGKRKTVRGFEDGYARYKERLTSKAQLARDLHISRPTLDKLIKEFENNHSSSHTERAEIQKQLHPQ